jgi:transcriptional regulator GlxA family with amidase domain
MKISIVMFDEFTDMDVFLMWDLLHRVDHPGWKIRLLGDAARHTSRTGIGIDAHGAVEEANTSDVVLFASGPGARKKIREPSYLARFKLNPDAQRIGSICSGALILAALGLLNGKRATTHPNVRHLLAEFPVEIVDEPFVLDGNVATAGGCLAAQELAGWIVEDALGKPVRDKMLAEIQPVRARATR